MIAGAHTRPSGPSQHMNIGHLDGRSLLVLCPGGIDRVSLGPPRIAVVEWPFQFHSDEFPKMGRQ